MKKLAILPLCLGCVFAVSTSRAIDLKQSKITQVVNDVQIISAASQQQKTATVNDVFSMPDILRTGPASRAELVAADETVTRVGANTIFSFDPATRTIDLQQGSLLFHSPHGMGGGTIHTGSATASVLGTTLIVTTTPDGGMKVLDLEGSVEVKFLSGLKQNLAPGHMAFVLPGGKQLSPIIVFRLDAVSKQSLLVNGFNQNLASMPLIQQQVEKQLKLISNGKLTDPGQLIGNSPGTLLDLTTLQAALDNSFKNSGSVQAALAFDATINQSSLIDPSIPVPPARIFLGILPPGQPVIPIVLTGNTFYTGKPFEGFAANNIFFNTIGLNPLTVDLSFYSNQSEFDMVAAGNMTFAGSVVFGGLSSDESIIFSLVAGKQIIVTPGATIRADVQNFNWETPDDLTLNGATVQNYVGNTSFGPVGGNFTMENGASVYSQASFAVQTAGNIAINNSTLYGNTVFLTSVNGTVGLDAATLSVGSFAILTAYKTMTINNSTINSDPGNGLLGFNSQAGSVKITGTSIQAQTVSVSSDNNISFDGTGQTYTIGNASFTAPNLITMNNVDFSNVGYLNAAANTITVMGSNFNPDKPYNFETKSGLPNIDNGVKGDELNLINDRFGNTPITSVNQINQTGGPSNAHGINSYKN